MLAVLSFAAVEGSFVKVPGETDESLRLRWPGERLGACSDWAQGEPGRGQTCISLQILQVTLKTEHFLIYFLYCLICSSFFYLFLHLLSFASHCCGL